MFTVSIVDENEKNIIEYNSVGKTEKTISESSIHGFNDITSIYVRFPHALFICHNGNDYDIIWGRFIHDLNELFDNVSNENLFDDVSKIINNFSKSINSINPRSREDSLVEVVTDLSAYHTKEEIYDPNIDDVKYKKCLLRLISEDNGLFYVEDDLKLPFGNVFVGINFS